MIAIVENQNYIFKVKPGSQVNDLACGGNNHILSIEPSSHLFPSYQLTQKSFNVA